VIIIIVHRYLGVVLKTPSFIKQEGATSQFYREQRRDRMRKQAHVLSFPSRSETVHVASGNVIFG